jgi:cobalamin biosynthetic protein CobC
MRARLADEAARLDALLASAGVPVAGGTALYRYLDFPAAGGLFEMLGRQGILLRHFAGRPHALRIGLPGGEAEWRRLAAALAVPVNEAQHRRVQGASA